MLKNTYLVYLLQVPVAETTSPVFQL